MSSNKQAISADGKFIYMNGATYKRTVLPSAARPHKSAQEIADVITELDNPSHRES